MDEIRLDTVRLIKDAHENAVDKGFYDCPICVDPETNEPIGCGNCDNTGKDHNKNIGELLMLIVSELGEALESHRNNRFCKLPDHTGIRVESITHDMHVEYEDIDKMAIQLFEAKIKDTFEDEIADVFIRLFDLCGYLGIEPGIENVSYFQNLKDKNIGNQLFDIVTTITDFNRGSNSGEIDRLKIVTWRALFQLNNFCTVHNIPIEKHIEAKMAYNRTREHKHGKAY